MPSSSINNKVKWVRVKNLINTGVIGLELKGIIIQHQLFCSVCSYFFPRPFFDLISGLPDRYPGQIGIVGKPGLELVVPFFISSAISAK